MWWSKNIPKHLPVSSGPYVPGCQDVMLGYGKNSLLLRLFYPTILQKDDKSNSKHWIPWLNTYDYLAGISKVITVPLHILQLVFWWRSVYNNNSQNSVQIPALYGQQAYTKNKLKCIIMSHGLGGCRFLYSYICYDLASYGFLVAVAEHKDSSSCYTYYYANEELAKQDCKTPIEFEHKLLGETHYGERNKQVSSRTEECSRIIDFFINLNNGNVPKNILDNVPSTITGSFKLDDFVGNLDLENLAIMGHSFGAATAMMTLARRKELKYGILLDPWMFPLKNEQLEEKIQQPLLFINTQTFHIVSNVNAMSKFLTDDRRKMFTILHTTHENQTDTAVLCGYWLNWFMRKLNPITGLKINQALILNFLHDNMNFPADVSECVKYLEREKQNVEFGLTKPWA